MVRATFWLLLLTLAAARADFFTPPEAPYLTAPDETVVPIDLAAEAAAAQLQLDAARAANPDAVLLLRLAAPLSIGAAPLTLRSKTVLTISEGAGLRASSDATAAALLRIDGRLVAVLGHGSTALDGGGRVAIGVDVTTGPAHLDRLEVVRCAESGIRYRGRGDDLRGEAGSISRCQIRDCGIGIDVAEAAWTAVLDNVCAGNRTGLRLAGRGTSVLGNRVVGNDIGLRVDGRLATVARNEVVGSREGLRFGRDAEQNFVASNRFGRSSEADAVLSGARNLLARNSFTGTLRESQPGADNLVMGPAVRPETTAVRWFDPPTFNDPHDRPSIVSGLGRVDIEVAGTPQRSFAARLRTPVAERAPMVDLAVAQQALDDARAAHPNDVIVCRLKGLFESTSKDVGLSIPENCCVILEGEIRDQRPLPDSGPAEDTQFVALASKGYVSLSGGVIDGDGRAFQGIHASGKNIALLDGVTVKNAGYNGICTKYHGNPSLPMVIAGCSVVGSAGRGIWVHVCRAVHVLDCTAAGNGLDGIDLDAYAMEGTALFNTSSGNRRHGVFVEEGIRDNLVAGNLLHDNLSNGVHVWNEAVKGNTGPNAILANRCLRNSTGISAGGRAADKTCFGNVFLNNVCEGNRRAGMVYGNRFSGENYFAMQVLRGNAEAVLNWTGGPLDGFFNPPGDRETGDAP